MYLCWSVKGGSGTSVVAAALALHLATTDPAWLIDLAGDAPAVLGVDAAGAPGVGDWMRSSVATPESLHALSIRVVENCALIPLGERDPSGDVGLLARALDGCRAVIDAGCGEPPPALAGRAEHSLLVIRPCVLALWRAQRISRPPTGVVLVVEPGRALKQRDVAAILGAPVVAEVRVDPAVTSAVDLGVFATRAPRSLMRQIASAA